MNHIIQQIQLPGLGTPRRRPKRQPTFGLANQQTETLSSDATPVVSPSKQINMRIDHVLERVRMMDGRGLSPRAELFTAEGLTGNTTERLTQPMFIGASSPLASYVSRSPP